MNERILVVDDEKAIADLVGIYLAKEGFDVQIAYSGADAAKAILEQEFDLALLDVMLPDIDGFELLRTIRSSHTYPVIMLTARDAQQDKIEGLSLGADDYVVKPFRPLELIARVHAQLRRYTSYGSRAQAAESPTIQLDGLEINRDARSVTVDGAPVRLTPTEYSILLYLVEHRGSVVAVEIDKALIPILQDTLKEWDNVSVIHGDILKTDIRKIADEKNQGRPIKVVANLPYYITTPIIMGLFESHVPVDSITVMVQKEVADRMQTGPGSKDYGALSLAVQYYAKPEIVANVPPNCFMPRPKVGSAVIRLTRHQNPPVTAKDEKLMFRIIRASFNQRRKTLVNGIRNSGDFSLSKEEIEDVFNRCDLPLNIRGEALTLEQFAMLANCIYDEKN